MKTLDGGRMGIASQALGIAQGAMDETVKYVKERKQFGRSIGQFQNTQFQLADLQTRIQAARLLVRKAAWKKDMKQPYSADSAQAKLFAAETAMEVTTKAVQFHGGYGYTREYPVEQCYRDNRLNPIHEGTHGIQSLDLLGRKLWQHNGKGLKLLMARMHSTLASAAQKPQLGELVSEFEQYLTLVQTTTLKLGGAMQTGQIEEALANSAVFLDMLGKTVVGWLWLEMADKALVTFAASSNAEDTDFVAGKLQAAQYFIRWEMPEIELQARLLQRFDRSCLDMQSAWF